MMDDFLDSVSRISTHDSRFNFLCLEVAKMIVLWESADVAESKHSPDSNKMYNLARVSRLRVKNQIKAHCEIVSNSGYVKRQK
jgi:DNA-binding GntR family transcriptional regulator